MHHSRNHPGQLRMLMNKTVQELMQACSEHNTVQNNNLCNHAGMHVNSMICCVGRGGHPSPFRPSPPRPCAAGLVEIAHPVQACRDNFRTPRRASSASLSRSALLTVSGNSAGSAASTLLSFPLVPASSGRDFPSHRPSTSYCCGGVLRQLCCSRCLNTSQLA